MPVPFRFCDARMNKTLSQETNAAVLWGKEGDRHVSQHLWVCGAKRESSWGGRVHTHVHKLHSTFDFFSKKHVWALGMEFILFL